MSDKTIKFGVIGIGGMGANYANLLLNNKIKNASLSAICDTNQIFSKNFPETPFYKNASDFFNKKIIDVAIIATPHTSHISLGIQALENNIDVIIEKPLAVTTKHCQEFINFSKSTLNFFLILKGLIDEPFIKTKSSPSRKSLSIVRSSSPLRFFINGILLIFG